LRTQPGGSRRSKFHFLPREASDRYEPEPVVGSVSSRFGFRRPSLVQCRRVRGRDTNSSEAIGREGCHQLC
jgi:hypothetical protein